VAVFAGFVPADDPVATIVVMADAPKGKYYGGQVSAPAFRKIAQGVLNYLEIAPTNPEEQRPRDSEKAQWTGKIAKRSIPKASISENNAGGLRMPDVHGMTIREVIHSCSGYSFKFKFEGSGVAVSQYPAAGEKVRAGDTCKISFKRRDA